MVIDDELPLRQMLRSTLQAKGFLVIEAANCQDAIRAAIAQAPDLIVSDINLPDGTGHDILDALKENPATSTVPFIFMTGTNDPNELRRSMEQGADDFLVKPFGRQILLATVEARLRRRSMLRGAGGEDRKAFASDCGVQPPDFGGHGGRPSTPRRILYLNQRRARDCFRWSALGTMFPGLCGLADIHPAALKAPRSWTARSFPRRRRRMGRGPANPR